MKGVENLKLSDHSQSRNSPFIQYSLLSLRWNPCFGLKSKISKVELETSLLTLYGKKKNQFILKLNLVMLVQLVKFQENNY